MTPKFSRVDVLVRYIPLTIMLFCITAVCGQNTFVTPDSLFHKPFGYFELRLDSDSNSSFQDSIYLNAYKQKAIKSKDWIELTKVYKNYIFKSDKSLRLIYADSMVAAAAKSEDDRTAAHAQITKGSVHYSLNQLEEALDSYKIANAHAYELSDEYFKYQIKYFLGKLKREVGYYDEAISLLNECMVYFEKDKGKPYLSTLQALSVCYYKVGQFSKASAINSLGVIESKKSQDRDMLPYFEFSEGVNKFLKGDYLLAIEKLTASQVTLAGKEDVATTTLIYYYLGKSYQAVGNKVKSIQYFLMVDDAYNTTGFLRPEMRDTFDILIDYYRTEEKYSEMIGIVNKLSKIDKFLDDNFRHLSSKIQRYYYGMKLEELVMDTSTRDENQTNWILTLSLTVVLLMAPSIWILIAKLKRDYKLKSRRKKLLKKGLPELSRKLKSAQDKIPEDVRRRLLQSLNRFEDELGFKDPKMTLVKLAVYLQSNTSYVSTLVNQNKGCPVNEYLNNLRIEYAFKLLREEKKFRRYSVKALSEEVGFGSQHNFSKLFKERVGMGLSDFLKSLN